MPMDPNEFQSRVTEHFKNVTEEEFLSNLRKSSPYLFVKDSEEQDKTSSVSCSESSYGLYDEAINSSLIVPSTPKLVSENSVNNIGA